ncbi:MAG TPA: hypothetical protein VGF20_13840, partial [Candidatus Acidoferrum sp.]
MSSQSSQGKVMFECPACGSTLKFDVMDSKSAQRLLSLFMLAAMFYFTWRHGWDHGFVLFYEGLYGCVGFLILFLVLPFSPRKLVLVAKPISSSYLRTEPLSTERYDERMSSDKPLG